MLRRLLLLPLLTSIWAQAETIYVDDVLRVGIRATQDGTTKPLEVVVSGTPLEVVSSENNHYLVRTPEGTEGWVNRAYTSKELPAQQRFEKVSRELTELQSRFDKTSSQFKETSDQNRLLADNLAEVTLRQERLTEELIQVESELNRYRHRDSAGWAYTGGAILAALLIGIWLGWWRYRERVRKRFGGLEL